MKRFLGIELRSTIRLILSSRSNGSVSKSVDKYGGTPRSPSAAVGSRGFLTQLHPSACRSCRGAWWLWR